MCVGNFRYHNSQDFSIGATHFKTHSQLWIKVRRYLLNWCLDNHCVITLAISFFHRNLYYF